MRKFYLVGYALILSLVAIVAVSANSGGPITGMGSSGRLAKFTGGSTIGNSNVREDGSGNVGVSSTHPQAKFLVQGGRLAVNGNIGGNFGVFIANQNGAGPIATFSKASGTDVKMVIDNAGNVGVGTNDPNSPLEVAGTIHTTAGGVKFPDGTIQTTAAAAGQGMRLVSTTRVNSVTNTGPISIAADKKYLVVADLEQPLGGRHLAIRFNGLSTAIYDYLYRSWSFEGVGEDARDCQTGFTSIRIQDEFAINGTWSGNFQIDTVKRAGRSVFLTGSGLGNEETSQDYAQTQFSGMVNADLVVTSFEFFLEAGDRQFSGNIHLYEYLQ